MAKNDYISVKVDNLDSENKVLRDDLSAVVTTREENRRDRKDKVTHFLAGAIILFFLVCVFLEVLFGKSVPNYFVSIVSMVVTFYFAKELAKKK